MDEHPAGLDRRTFALAGALIATMVVATLTVVAILILFRGGDEPPAAVAPVATPNAGSAPTLLKAIELRSGPAPDVAIVTLLQAGTALRVVGRSADGQWLVVAPESRPSQLGWVPASTVAGVDVAGLTVVAPASASGTPRQIGPTETPDLPDLRVVRAFARSNQLMVEIANEGAGDALGVMLVSVNAAAPIRLEVKSGEPLRPGERLEAPVPGIYVQLRAPVTVEVILEGGGPEELTDNNSWDDIVSPDVPNDIEVRSAGPASDDGHLVVVLANNSPIPLSGSVTVSVRESLPSTNLLARDTRPLELSIGGMVDFAFPDLKDLDLTKITIRLSTDAIDDAVIANNSFPR